MKKTGLVWNYILLLTLLAFGRSHPPASQAAAGGAAVVYFPIVPVSAPVEIVDAREYRTKDAKHRVIGEVTNTSDRPVYDVEVTVVFYDASDQVIGIETRPAALTAALPGQVNPFDIITNVPSLGELTYYRISISRWSWQGDRVYRAAAAKVTDIVAICDAGTTVTVEVANDGSQPLADVVAVVWSGADLKSRRIGTLSLGETVSFVTELYGVCQEDPSQINVAAQGAVAP
jgi:hypothetical protein